MDAEKLAMQRRIDTLDEYATRLHAALTEYERENARLKAELETVKREKDAAADCIFNIQMRVRHSYALDMAQLSSMIGNEIFAWSNGLKRGVGGAEDA